MQLVPCILYVNAAAPLLIAVASGMKEGLKGRVTYRITFTSLRVELPVLKISIGK